jgi:hypothetical protein
MAAAVTPEKVRAALRERRNASAADHKLNFKARQ